jgi:phosphoribosyl 1,2-cyclic phosphodiesterase
MNVQFCVLGSGSRGNAALVMTPECHVLIDAGFSPKALAVRMEGTGTAWESLDAVVITHIHTDHVKLRCLAKCADHAVQLVCHREHAAYLKRSPAFRHLDEKGLVTAYDSMPFEIGRILKFYPLRVPHDSPPTYGFRIEVNRNGCQPDGRLVKLGYLVDLGCCVDELAAQVADVDLLALEFNHDETMELNSGRHPHLIDRVLGPQGHLSNTQATEVFRRVVESRGDGGPSLLLQMHLSRDCNDPKLAHAAALAVVRAAGARTQVFSTRQDERGTVHSIV